MKKVQPVVILPMDGYSSPEHLIIEVANLFEDKDLCQLVSHIKLNDGVHWMDAGGPAVITLVTRTLRELGSDAKIFLDLKIFDVSATLVNTLKKYVNNGFTPDILTVSASCCVEGIVKLRMLLPDTKLAMVSVLTDISGDECLARFGQAPAIKIFNDLENIRRIYKEKMKQFESQFGNWSSSREPFDLVVCSGEELDFLNLNLSDDYGFIVPGIRDEWMRKLNEHQKRIIGIYEALSKRATFAVMGAQMTKGNPDSNISAAESRKLTFAEIAKFYDNQAVGSDPLEILKNCDGYYESPRDTGGNYVGPVVGYAKKYKDENDEDKNMVGFVYLNFAKAEQRPKVREYFASSIVAKIAQTNLKVNVVLGAPMGGLYLAADIGRALDAQTIFAEKVVTIAADKVKNVREESHLIIDRHDIHPGDQVILVEDVCNNFSTTEQIGVLVNSYGADLVGIVCAFNRSGKSGWANIPVISACDVVFEQYKQNDSMVAEIIAAGNFIVKPKLQWAELSKAMDGK